ncbi:MAG TPA: hypothetical protein VES39_06605, partial [Rhodospirillales bacterium]|nr:hypothetical protein [Rhodospirillales bacterium]
VSARSSLALFPDGRLDGTADATLVLANVDAARLGGGRAKLDQGSLAINGRYAVDGEGSVSFAGGGEAKLHQASGTLADGTALSLAAATLGLPEVGLSVPGDGALNLTVHPALDVEKLALAGPAEGSAERLTVDLARLAVVRGADTTISVRVAASDGEATGAATAGGGRIVLAAPALRTPLTFTADTLGVELGTLAVQAAADGKLALTGDATLRTTNAAVVPAAPPGQAAPSVRFASLAAPLGPLTLHSAGDRLQLTGPVKATAERVDVALAPPTGEPQRLAAETFSLSMPSLSVETGASGVGFAGVGSVDLARPVLTLPATAGQPAASLAAATVRLTLAETKAAQDGADLRVDGGVGGELNGVTASWGGTPAPAPPPPARRGQRTVAPPATEGGRLALDSLRLAAAPVSVRTSGNRRTFTGNVSTDLAGLKATVPAEPQQAPWDIALQRLRIALSGIDGEELPALTTARVKLDVTAGGLVAQQPAPPLPRAPANNRTRLALQDMRLAPATVGVRIL